MRPANSLLVSAAAALCVSACVHAETITGHIFEQDGVTPIACAIVALQATGIQTTTTADGSYALEVGTGADLVIVGAKKRYFNASTLANAGDTGVDIILAPVPQDNDPTYFFMPPTGCAMCHPDQYDEWNGSPMSQTGQNTWVHDIYSGTGTPGGMGGFVYLRDSAFADTNPTSECASCHQPEHWLDNLFGALVGPTEPQTPAVKHGVSCEMCHKLADIDVSKVNFPGLYPGVATVTRPAAPDYLQVQYGVFPDADFSLTVFMRASYNPQLVAETCAACHQDANDPNEDHSFTGVIFQPTYLEWAGTPYADPNSPRYASCVDCHMPATDRTIVCYVLLPALERPLGSIRSHRIVGTTPQFLDNAVELALQTDVVGNELRVGVTITNEHAGHDVPTGVTMRNMILLVEAWPTGSDPNTSLLPLVSGSTVHKLGGVGDPAQGYYAGRPGKLYARVNHDAQGHGPTVFTEATGILFDNRIPALASDHTEYGFRLPLTGGPIRVRARVIYRRAFRGLVDAKQWTSDGHGQSLADLAPPHFGHLMESAEATVVTRPTGGACCHGDGACTFATDDECVGAIGGVWLGVGSHCGDDNLDGFADACDGIRVIPTMSDWGLVVLALLLLVAYKIKFGLPPRRATA